MYNIDMYITYSHFYLVKKALAEYMRRHEGWFTVRYGETPFKEELADLKLKVPPTGHWPSSNVLALWSLMTGFGIVLPHF